MDFRDHSISDLVKKVKNKEISAKELTEAAISNIEKYDDAINAFCALNNEDAIKQAESWKSGKLEKKIKAHYTKLNNHYEVTIEYDMLRYE